MGCALFAESYLPIINLLKKVNIVRDNAKARGKETGNRVPFVRKSLSGEAGNIVPQNVEILLTGLNLDNNTQN